MMPHVVSWSPSDAALACALVSTYARAFCALSKSIVIPLISQSIIVSL